MSYNMSCINAFVDANEMDYFQVIVLCNQYGVSLLSVIKGESDQLEVLFC